MSASLPRLSRQIWDEHNARGHEIDRDAIDADFIARVVIDVEQAKHAACAQARRNGDLARTTCIVSQLMLPTLADDDEDLVTGPSVRVQKAKALDADFLASRELSEENVAKPFEANQTRHRDSRSLAPSRHRGMTQNEAVTAFSRDHPDEQRATP